MTYRRILSTDLDRGAVRALAVLATLVFGCSNLEPIAADVCGNHVVERGVHEECDGGPGCGAPEGIAPCRFSCDAAECPEGYGCGLDQVCRRPSGDFLLVPTTFDDQTRKLVVADADGDGHDDVLRVGAEHTALEFYGDAAEVAAATTLGYSDVTPGNPLLEDLNGDGRRDLGLAVGEAFVSQGLGVYRLREDRGLDPTVYVSLPIQGQSLRAVHAYVLPPYLDDEALAFVDGFLLGISPNNSEPVLVNQDAPIHAAKIDGIVAAHFAAGSACDRLVVGEGDATAVYVINPCFESVDELGNPTVEWRSAFHPADVTMINLPGAGRVRDYDPVQKTLGRRQAIFAVDWNFDGALDVAVTPKAPPDAMFVALGDGNGNFATPTVEQLYDRYPDLNACAGTVAEGDQGMEKPCAPPDSSPLDFADFNGDGAPDLVREDGIYLFGGFFSWTCTCHWLDVVVQDFDGNGTMDVAGSNFDDEGIEFLNGAGTGAFTRATLSTQGEAMQMVGGDFDGDLVNDLVFFEEVPVGDEDVTSLSVAFGRSAGPPEQPIIVGQIPEMRQIVAGRIVGGDSASDLALIAATEGTADLSLAFVPGTSSRELTAPFYLSVPVSANPIATAMLATVVGSFGGAEGERTFGFITRDVDFDSFGYQRPWLLTAIGDAQLAASVGAYDTLEAGYYCDPCVAVAVDLDGDGVDEMVSLGDRAFGLGEIVAHVHTVGEGGFELAEDVDFTDFLFILDAPPIAADLDADGRKDLVTVGVGWDPLTFQPIGSAQVVVFWNEGDGTLHRPLGVDIAGSPLALALIELDGDPLPEVIVGFEDGYGVVQVAPGRELATVAVDELPNIKGGKPPQGRRLGVGDLDGDGVQDLVVAGPQDQAVLRGVAEEP
jgi:FG-GAP repeat protein